MLDELRYTYPHKLIIQGYEMNVPGHEHGSLSIIGEQFGYKKRNVKALAQFEYMFDNSDRDTEGGLVEGWIKSTASGHEKTLEAIKYLQENHRYTSWLVPAHPERQKKYSIADFRDMNNAGPDVCFGFESMPGHQKEAVRGGYSTTAFGGTYGGCGYFAAKVGGLWDAMLSEGRNWWLFASSDFHDINGDFYPGEYQKTYTYVQKKNNYSSLYKGLRSGNSWIVTGDLIDNLQFNAFSKNSWGVMGQTINLRDKTLVISIRVHDPKGKNFNTYSDYTMPELNHVDLIAGYLHAKYAAADSMYQVDNTEKTNVIARFDAQGGIKDSNGLTSSKWINRGNGWYEIYYVVKNVSSDMYFRLRGTNLGISVENETDSAGNPMADALLGSNNAAKAFADLWFYSNPIFVKVNSSCNSGFKSTEEEDQNSEITDSECSFEIYPNPSSDIINITNFNMEQICVSICDLSGQQVKVVESTNEILSINIEDLKNGIYIVTIKSESKVSAIKITKK